MNPHRVALAETKKRVLEAWQAGFDTAEIARKLKISEAIAYNLLAQHHDERASR